MNNNHAEKDIDIIELFEFLAAYPVEYPMDLLEARQTEVIKYVENLNLDNQQKSNNLLVPQDSQMTLTMKVILGLIITANIALAIYIINFIVQNYDHILQLLSR